MKMTSAEASKLLKKYNEEKESILKQEEAASTFNASVGEDPESVRPDYDYGKTQERIGELNKKIVAIKHALNMFNISTRLPGSDCTIDMALVMMPMLTAQKEKLKTMKDRPAKQRDMGPFRSSIVDYKYANYRRSDAEKDYREVSDRLSDLQLKLDMVNTSETFEVEI